MAQNEIHKIITIEFKNSELIDKMREAQNAIKALNTETKYLKEDLNEYRQQLKSGAISQDQFDRMMIKTKNEIIKNDQAVIKYKSDIKAYTRELQSNIRQDKEKVGSLNQLRSSVKSLTAEYNNLSAAERGGVRGKEIVRQIQKTTAEIGRQENALRNYHIGVEAFRKRLLRSGRRGWLFARRLASFGIALTQLKISSRPMLISVPSWVLLTRRWINYENQHLNWGGQLNTRPHKLHSCKLNWQNWDSVRNPFRRCNNRF